MTTSWAHLVRGQVIRACRANAGGTLLGIVAVVLGPWSLISGIRGRWLWQPMSERVALTTSLGLVMVTLIDWGVRFFLEF
jgi:hypothetical protein